MTYILPHTIRNSAERFPEKEAFKCLNKSLTYAEIAEQMYQLAHLLIHLGVKKGDRVGVLLNRCLETAPAIYGIMCAGAAYVPIDPNLPLERIAFLIENCGIRQLVTNKAQKSKLNKLLENSSPLEAIIGIKADWPTATYSWTDLQDWPNTDPVVNILGDDLAYILHTSGSTGLPKGIMHSHRSGLAYAKLTVDTYHFTPEDIFGNHAPIFFDISTMGYFTAPLVGGTTIIVSDAHTKMPASLSQLIEKEKITVWYSVPLALIQMMQMGALDQRDWSALKWLFYAGEPFAVKHLIQLMKQLTHVTFGNIYGPTETNQCTFYNLPAIPEEGSSIPLGYIWGDTEMRILDEDNQAVEQGEVGELLIRSATRMLGYWKKPKLTQSAHWIETTDYGEQQLFYRTGDLVRLNAEGLIMLLGRKDRQVKTRGFRVELDEVEGAILTHEAINEVAVFTVLEQEETKAIYAAIILKQGKELSIKALNQYLKNILPVYAIPKEIFLLEDFPRTATGKVNRNLLREKYKYA